MNRHLLSHTLFLGLVFAGLTGPSFGDISLPYGTGNDHVAFANASNHPGTDDPVPVGPLAFRASGEEFWVADTIGSRIYQVSAAGKITARIPVAEHGKKPMLQDLALVKDAGGKVTSVWILNSTTQEVLQVALNGKILAKLGGHGKDAGRFLQAERIEVDQAGHVYVADVARRCISVFDSAKKALVREVPWEWSGFCLDDKGNLCRLHWAPTEKKTHLVIETPDGKQLRDSVLPLGDHMNPVLWSVSEAAGVLVSFTPKAGFKGTYTLAHCGIDGAEISSTQFKPPFQMNRYLESADGKAVWLAVADYREAPKGSFGISRLAVK